MSDEGRVKEAIAREKKRKRENSHEHRVLRTWFLVHGAFADGSGWEAVANILKNDGYKVSVVQHPETSYAEDQKVHEGGYRRHGRASGSGGPQLWAVPSSPRPKLTSIQRLWRSSILPHLHSIRR